MAVSRKLKLSYLSWLRKLKKHFLSWLRNDRSGQVGTGQNRSDQVSTGQDRSGQVGTVQEMCYMSLLRKLKKC